MAVAIQSQKTAVQSSSSWRCRAEVQASSVRRMSNTNKQICYAPLYGKQGPDSGQGVEPNSTISFYAGRVKEAATTFFGH